MIVNLMPIFSNKLLISVFSGALIITVAVVGWAFLGLGKNSSINLLGGGGERNIAGSPSPMTTIAPPVSLSNPAVKTVKVSYTFAGTLKSLRTIPEGLEITTSIKGEGIPRFLATDKTMVVFTKDGQDTEATQDDLAPGQKLRITAGYDINKNNWTVSKVRIMTK